MDLKLSEVIQQVGSEKGVDRKVLIETLEVAIATAAKRIFGQEREIEAYYNEQLDEIELFQILQVTEEVDNPCRDITMEDATECGFDVQLGDELLVQIFYRAEDKYKAIEQDKRYGDLLQLESARNSFGRIAAQTAKQVILQRMREAEQDIVYNQYKDRVGELISGTIRRIEKGNFIVELDRADAILPTREQTPRENYRLGDRIQAYVKAVQRSSHDPQIILSRNDPELIIKLFEQEVPEITEGIVRIVRVSREAGLRSKIAVYSRDADVDPVGACVGMRGARVQAVVKELNNEKIDIVPYHEEGARFVCNAISPAEVSKVLIDERTQSMELIVPDDQLSLAIGRNGQNVRLAAQLTGWNLDIISESRLRSLMDEAKKDLLAYGGIEEGLIDTLFTLGYNKIDHIAQAQPMELAQIPGFGLENAEHIIEAAQEILEKAQASRNNENHTHQEITEILSILNVGERIATMLHNAGYRTPSVLLMETDPARMDAKSGVGQRKASQVIEKIQKYAESRKGYDADALAEQRARFNELIDSCGGDIARTYETAFGPIELGQSGLTEPIVSEEERENANDGDEAAESEN